jgi:DNA-directed RNA polymerase specialized sigma24 family protein
MGCGIFTEEMIQGFQKLLAGSGDYTYEQISQMLGCPLGTVKWRVSEARRLLKAKLEAHRES